MALEVERLVNKVYKFAPTLVDGNQVQAFIDGIRDLKIRAVLRLGYHKIFKDALAHALEVEVVREHHRLIGSGKLLRHLCGTSLRGMNLDVTLVVKKIIFSLAALSEAREVHTKGFRRLGRLIALPSNTREYLKVTQTHYQEDLVLKTASTMPSKK